MMAMITRPADHVDADPEVSQQSYHRWHLESSEVDGQKASA